LPLKAETASVLQPFLTGKMPHTQVFRLPGKTADMLRADLVAAGIPYTDAAGRDFDFHALRHQFGTMLAAGGGSPKVAQE